MMVRFREADRETLDQLRNLPIHTLDDSRPLGSLADFAFVAGPKSIERENRAAGRGHAELDDLLRTALREVDAPEEQLVRLGLD